MVRNVLGLMVRQGLLVAVCSFLLSYFTMGTTVAKIQIEEINTNTSTSTPGFGSTRCFMSWNTTSVAVTDIFIFILVCSKRS